MDWYALAPYIRLAAATMVEVLPMDNAGKMIQCEAKFKVKACSENDFSISDVPVPGGPYLIKSQRNKRVNELSKA